MPHSSQMTQIVMRKTCAYVKVVGLLCVLLAGCGSKKRFKQSREVGCYLGLRPRRSQSGDRDPQLGVTKAGNVYLRSLLIECANHILRPHGRDSALRQWGLHLASRGGKQAKNKAVVAVARKLAVLPPHLDDARSLHALLRRCGLRNDHIYLLRRHRVPMTASAFWPSSPAEKWQHRLSS
jgi:hypothetical protein